MLFFFGQIQSEWCHPLLVNMQNKYTGAHSPGLRSCFSLRVCVQLSLQVCMSSVHLCGFVCVEVIVEARRLQRKGVYCSPLMWLLTHVVWSLLLCLVLLFFDGVLQTSSVFLFKKNASSGFYFRCLYFPGEPILPSAALFWTERLSDSIMSIRNNCQFPFGESAVD